jgi:hypothetical protein
LPAPQQRTNRSAAIAPQAAAGDWGALDPSETPSQTGGGDWGAIAAEGWSLLEPPAPSKPAPGDWSALDETSRHTPAASR